MKLCLALIVVLLFASGCGFTKTIKVPTSAMEPTIKAGNTVEADAFHYVSNNIQRFDIVIFNAPEELAKREGKDRVLYVKRVIAFPGESVEIKKGKVYINGQFVNEPFQIIPFEDDFGPIKVPDQEYFLLGDNRGNSLDSRHSEHSTIKESDILLKVVKINHS